MINYVPRFLIVYGVGNLHVGSYFLDTKLEVMQK